MWNKEAPEAGVEGALYSIPGPSTPGLAHTHLPGWISSVQEKGLLAVQGPHRQKTVFEFFDCERAK